MSDQNELTAIFESRDEAAQRLADKLRNLKGQNALVLAIPRSSVPMGRIVADAIEGELDLLLIHRFTDSRHPELDLGSVTEDGEVYLNRSAQHYGYTEHEVEKAALEEIRNLQEQRRTYTPGSSAIDPSGRTTLIVDDGTGSLHTMMAAVRYLDAQGARRIMLATPVASLTTIKALGENVDVCTLAVPDIVDSATGFYRNLPLVSDHQVIQELNRTLRIPAQNGEESRQREILISSGPVALTGFLSLPEDAGALVILAHGQGQGRFNWRSRLIADSLEKAGLATLMVDLLDDEESEDSRNVTNVPLLAHRLNMITEWIARDSSLREMDLGYYGSSSEGAAILQTAAEHRLKTRAAAVRGTRPDATQSYLKYVQAPTLLIVPGDDDDLLNQNRSAFEELRCEKRLQVMPDASEDFEEPGTSETLADLVTGWFRTNLARALASDQASDQASADLEKTEARPTR
jgi:putative phosphoribosyl transferase